MEPERFSENGSSTPPVEQFWTIQTCLFTRKHLFPNSLSMKKRYKILLNQLIGIFKWDMWIIKTCFDAFIQPGTKYRTKYRQALMFRVSEFPSRRRGWMKQFAYFAKPIYLFLDAPPKNCMDKKDYILNLRLSKLQWNTHNICTRKTDKIKHSPSESHPPAFLLSGPHGSLSFPSLFSFCVSSWQPSFSYHSTVPSMGTASALW